MATAKICDRCGAVINPPNSGLFITLGPRRHGEEGEEKDLCVSCAFELKKFLRDDNIREEG